jgi:hypothetical protein
VGAFEFQGKGGIPVGGTFRVVTTSLVPIGGETVGAGATTHISPAPNAITVTFSGNVNPAMISATDLVLSGSAVNANSHPVSLTWIDAHTVKFNLAGALNSSGTVDITIAPNTIQSSTGALNQGYTDDVVLSPMPVSPTPTPTPTPTPSEAYSRSEGTAASQAQASGSSHKESHAGSAQARAET